MTTAQQRMLEESPIEAEDKRGTTKKAYEHAHPCPNFLFFVGMRAGVGRRGQLVRFHNPYFIFFIQGAPQAPWVFPIHNPISSDCTHSHTINQTNPIPPHSCASFGLLALPIYRPRGGRVPGRLPPLLWLRRLGPCGGGGGGGGGGVAVDACL